MIQLEQMEFYAFHGYFNEEQVAGNRFIVNVDLVVDLMPAAKTDSLNMAIDYQSVYELIKLEMGNKSKLLENICFRIVMTINDHYPDLEDIIVKIAKQNPPMEGKMNAVSVTMNKKDALNLR